MNLTRILTSSLDRSANFIFDNALEARYVHRNDRLIVYLSSQTGCGMACRMCHLTQTGQTFMIDATPDQFFVQAKTVIDHYITQAHVYRKHPRVNTIHFNWMARGEPFLNLELFTKWRSIRSTLAELAESVDIDNVAYNISTILPKNMPQYFEFTPLELLTVDGTDTRVYYSMYGTDEHFRKRWLPNALPVDQALSMLKEWQTLTGGKIVIHGSFIKGENDGMDQIQAMKEVISNSGVNATFNLVRYNPFSPNQGQETDEEALTSITDSLADVMIDKKVQWIPRVGQDVFASCGMFSASGG